jgi:CheY-like chemotaxis protein
MDDRPNPRVTFSDRIDGGVVVGFDDGKTAFFPAALLHATLPQAQMMPSDSEGGLPHER